MKLPDFLIIGAMQADTTSLYHDLLQNPAIQNYQWFIIYSKYAMPMPRGPMRWDGVSPRDQN